MLKRWRLLIASCLALALTAGAIYCLGRSPGEIEAVKVWPAEVAHPDWDRLIGGDDGISKDEVAALRKASAKVGHESSAVQVASQVTVADLTATNRAQFGLYWPQGFASDAGQCSQVEVETVSLVSLPAGVGPKARGVVKALVMYTGACVVDGSSVTYTSTSPGFEYVYLQPAKKSPFWVPVRDWSLVDYRHYAQEQDLEEWQLAPIAGCGGSGGSFQARTVVASAFAQLCAAAADAGVTLVVDSAYRTAKQQQKLWNEAVSYYGSEAAAARWVTFSDGVTCKSRNCAGEAIGVEPDRSAVSWLGAVAGCLSGSPARFAEATSCGSGERVVSNANRYGFSSPYTHLSGYLEFSLALDAVAGSGTSCSPTGLRVDAQIASVFRCRLQIAGLSELEIGRTVAEAVTVSRCASGWEPRSIAFGGKYRESAHPVSGKVYTNAGVFMLDETVANTGWLDGEVSDPVASAHAAASIWLATRSWRGFACADGSDKTLAPEGPVLSQFGGPALPNWATAM